MVLLSYISLSLERKRRSRRSSSRRISSEPIKEESTNGTISGKTIQGKDQLVEEEAAGIGSVSFLFCVLYIAQRGKGHWRIKGDVRDVCLPSGSNFKKQFRQF